MKEISFSSVLELSPQHGGWGWVGEGYRVEKVPYAGLFSCSLRVGITNRGWYVGLFMTCLV